MIDRDLFVSYGTRDAKDVAEALVADLEARGIVCWLAPRDIPAGSRSWASEIVKGIRSSANFLLLLSAGANASEEIEKELDEAARQRKPLFVIRIEDIEPSEGLGYHLNRVQWRDLFRNREVVLNEIVARVVALRAAVAGPSPASLVPPIMTEMPRAATTPADLSADLPVTTRRRGGSPGLMAAGLLLTTLVATAGWFLSGGRDMPRQPDATVTIASPASPAAPPAAQSAAQPPADSSAPAGVASPVTPVASSDVSYQQGALIRAILSANPATVEAAQRAQRYLAAPRDRALAASTAASETWFAATAPSEPAAREWALERCELRFAKPCGLVAVNEAAVAPFRVSPMPRIAYSGSFDPAMIPVVTEERRLSREVQNYRSAPGFKAAAIHPWGRIFLANGAVTPREAEETALSACNGDQARAGREGPCFLYAVGMQILLQQRATTPVSIGPPQSDAAKLLTDLLAQAAPMQPDSPSQIAQYLAASRQRALAVAPNGKTWFAAMAPTELEAEQLAIERCHLRYDQPCRLVAINEGSRLFLERTLVVSARRLAYSGAFDVDQVPGITDERRLSSELARYLMASGPKAAAIHAGGAVFLATSTSSQRAAEESALAACKANPQPAGREGPCLLYASGLQVVLPQRRETPLATSP